MTPGQVGQLLDLLVTDKRVANVEVNANGLGATLIVHSANPEPGGVWLRKHFYGRFADVVVNATLDLGITERLPDGTLAIRIADRR